MSAADQDEDTRLERERRSPGLRERCQEGYLLLRTLLERAGMGKLVEPVKGIDVVDDVLRTKPEIVPTLLTTAWGLRGEKVFQPLFLHQKTGAPVTSQKDPIAPCGRTFQEVMQAHLYGAARLYFDRLEREWAAQRARQAEAKWKKQQQDKKKSLTGRLMSNLRDIAAEDQAFEPARFRSSYQGYGLYTVIRDHLKEDWQFRLIPLYATMTPRQAEALGDVLTWFREPKELEVLLKLDTADISLARSLARLYSEAIFGLSRNPDTRRMDADELETYRQRVAQAAKEERKTFNALLTRHIHAMPALKETGAAIEQITRRLAPVFRDAFWDLFKDPTALNNAVNCPDFILKVIGVSARALPPRVGTVLTQIQNRDLTRDILVLALERFSREDLESYLSDPERFPLWNYLPAKFNNVYRYQADAPSDSNTLRNFENLKLVCEGYFDSLKSGRADRYLDQQ